jgi:hypothetical protein
MTSLTPFGNFEARTETAHGLKAAAAHPAAGESGAQALVALWPNAESDSPEVRVLAGPETTVRPVANQRKAIRVDLPSSGTRAGYPNSPWFLLGEKDPKISKARNIAPPVAMLINIPLRFPLGHLR